jgi:energy-coupling factor transport system ATP-binding protein
MSAAQDAGGAGPPISAGGSGPLVSVRDVRFAYPGGRVALDGVTLDVRRGEVLGLAGPNGSGKSTLARLLAGLLRPTTGRVVVGGLDTTRTPARALASVVGYVFQDPGHQLFAATVRAELAFGPRNLGAMSEEVERRVAEEAARLGLEDRLDTHPYRLARSVRRLVAIASVLTMHPAVVILDEPTTGQDHATATRVRTLVRDLRDRGIAVVCITHDMTLLATVADRLVVLEGGRVLADAPPRDVFADPGLLARAGLEPPGVTRLALQLVRPPGEAPWPALTPDELLASLRGSGPAGVAADIREAGT